MASEPNVAVDSTRDNSEVLPEIEFDFVQDIPDEGDVTLTLDDWLDFLASHEGVLS